MRFSSVYKALNIYTPSTTTYVCSLGSLDRVPTHLSPAKPMADYHTVYKGPEGETTQWDDIQRKLGNLPPKEPVWKPDAYAPEAEEAKDEKWLDKKDEQELSDLEDEFGDDRFLEEYRWVLPAASRLCGRCCHPCRRLAAHCMVCDPTRRKPVHLAPGVERSLADHIRTCCTHSPPPGASTAPFLCAALHHPATPATPSTRTRRAHCRQRRLAELRQEAATPRFGSVEDIRGSEFVAAVTEASRTGPTWVVVLLYKDSSAGSQLMGSCLTELACKHPGTKFVRIVSTDCIPNYPDCNLPTLLVYHNGACKQHLVGLAQFGGRLTTPEQVALVLNSYGPICGEGEEWERQQAAVRGLVQRLVEQREGQGRPGGGGDD